VSIVPEPVWRLDASLGEGPVWLPDEQALRFVDIKRGLLHRYDPPATAVTRWRLAADLRTAYVTAARVGLTRRRSRSSRSPAACLPSPHRRRGKRYAKCARTPLAFATDRAG
jgi:hypothetical protein